MAGHWSLGQGGFFRPLVILIYRIDLAIWHLHPGGYRITNLSLHTINALLVVALSAQLFRWLGATRYRWPSIAAGVTFLVMPSHSESVSWVAGRTDLLATAAMLLSLISYVAWRQGGRRLLLHVSLSAFSAALLAKESAVVLPVVVLLVECVAGNVRRAVRPILAFFGLLAVYVPVRTWAVGELVGGYGIAAHLGLSQTALLAHIIVSAARVFLPPWPPSIVSWTVSQLYMSPTRWLVLIAGVGCAAWAATILIKQSPRWFTRLLPLLVLGFIITIPLLGDQGVELADTRGERFLYTPSVFMAVLAGSVLALLSHRQRLAVSLAVIWTIFLGAALMDVNEHWHVASELTRRLTDGAVSLSTRRQLVVVNAPADYRGRWIFLVGFREALIFRGLEGPEIQLISTHSISALTDAAGVRAVEGGCVLELQSGTAGPPRFYKTPAARIVDRSASGFRFVLAPAWTGADVIFYSSGMFHRVPATCTGRADNTGI